MTCKIAYTINGRQPVSCSIIGDQPLWDLDDEWDDVAKLIIDEYIDAIGYEHTVALIKCMTRKINDTCNA